MSTTHVKSDEILIGAIDDEKVKDIFEKLYSVFPEHSYVEYLTGPDIVIPNINNMNACGRYIIQKAILRINLKNVPFSNNQNFSLNILNVFFNRTPGDKDAPLSPWINSFWIETHNNKSNSAIANFCENWLHTYASNIVNIVEIIKDNTSIPPSDPSSSDFQIATLFAGMKDAHQRIMFDYQHALKELDTRAEKLEDKFQEKEDEREKDYQEKLEEIAREKEELDKASHKSERRKLFSKITEAESISKRKKHLSIESIIIRWGIVIICIFISFISSAMAMNCLYSLSRASFVIKEMNGIYEYLIFKSIASSAMAIGSLFFAARWMQSFYKEDVKRSEEVERFTADMIRASWAIETILEVQEEYGKEVPEILIKGMVNGLFEDKEKSNEASQASLALQALLGFTGSASFGPNGPTFEIGKKEAKALAKTDASPAEKK